MAVSPSEASVTCKRSMAVIVHLLPPDFRMPTAGGFLPLALSLADAPGSWNPGDCRPAELPHDVPFALQPGAAVAPARAAQCNRRCTGPLRRALGPTPPGRHTATAPNT